MLTTTGGINRQSSNINGAVAQGTASSKAMVQPNQDRWWLRFLNSNPGHNQLLCDCPEIDEKSGRDQNVLKLNAA